LQPALDLIELDYKLSSNLKLVFFSFFALQSEF